MLVSSTAVANSLAVTSRCSTSSPILIPYLRDTNGVTRSLYCLRHTYATFRLASGTDIHQLATQMGTSVKMLETFYSKVSPQMNAAIHSGRLETMWREEQED